MPAARQAAGDLRDSYRLAIDEEGAVLFRDHVSAEPHDALAEGLRGGPEMPGQKRRWRRIEQDQIAARGHHAPRSSQIAQYGSDGLALIISAWVCAKFVVAPSASVAVPSPAQRARRGQTARSRPARGEDASVAGMGGGPHPARDVGAHLASQIRHGPGDHGFPATRTVRPCFPSLATEASTAFK